MSAGKHTAKWAIQPGELYVYRDEDGDAVAIAKACTGPNGGFVGADICKVSLPNKYSNGIDQP